MYSNNQFIKKFLFEREMGLVDTKRVTNSFMKRVYSNIRPLASWKDRSKPTGGIFNLEFNSEGTMLIGACEKKALLVFDPLNAKLLHRVNNAHDDCVNCIKFLDSRIFASCSDDNTVALWDARYLKNRIRRLQGHSNWVKNIEYSKKDGLLISSSFDGSIFAWDINGRTESNCVHNRLFHTNGLMRTKLSYDASKMILCNTTGYIMVVHDLDMTNLWQDLCGFKPNLYRLMQISGTIIAGAINYNHLFSSKRRRNRIEFITDFPLGDDAEVISSLQIHPQGVYAVSRNTTNDESGEWTCVHDIRSPPSNYDNGINDDPNYARNLTGEESNSELFEEAQFIIEYITGVTRAGYGNTLIGGRRRGRLRRQNAIRGWRPRSVEAMFRSLDSNTTGLIRRLIVEAPLRRPFLGITRSLASLASMSSTSSSNPTVRLSEYTSATAINDGDIVNAATALMYLSGNGSEIPQQFNRERVSELSNGNSSYHNGDSENDGDSDALSYRTSSQNEHRPDSPLPFQSHEQNLEYNRLANTESDNEDSSLYIDANGLVEDENESEEESLDDEQHHDNTRNSRYIEVDANRRILNYDSSRLRFIPHHRILLRSNNTMLALEPGTNEIVRLNGGNSIPAPRPPGLENVIVHKNEPRLTHYIQESNVGSGFIKELCFSNDGRLIGSPYGKGVRLLSLTPECRDDVVMNYNKNNCSNGNNHTQLYELLTLKDCHSQIVVSTRFSPTHTILVSGCLGGELVWNQPVI